MVHCFAFHLSLPANRESVHSPTWRDWVGSRWGQSSLLFTLGHFWQPYNYPLIFLLVLPEGFPVYWKRNTKIFILLHCTGNTFAA